MPDEAFIASVRRHGFGLAAVADVAADFSTSFEATIYRMAQTASFPAAAAKFCYRFSKSDLRTKPAAGQLFPMLTLQWLDRNTAVSHFIIRRLTRQRSTFRLGGHFKSGH